MKKTLRVTIASTLAIGILTTGVAFADNNAPISAVPINAPIVKPIYKLIINEKVLDANTYVSEDTIMIPLRAISENLGYEVSWDDAAKKITLIRGPHYVTLSPTADEYTFSKMAPAKLGKAPELIDGTTYVPISFIGKILPSAQYEVAQNGEIKVNEEKEDVKNYRTVTVKEVNKDGSILINDEVVGEAIVRFTEETVFDGLKKEDIKANDIIDVEFSPVMAPSIPAQMTAVKVSVHKDEVVAEKEENPYRNVSVLEVNKDDTILVKDDTIGEVVVRFTPDTKWAGVEKKDIKVNDKLSIQFSLAMTFSLPPQTNALNVTTVKNDEDDKKDVALDQVKYEGTIKSIEEDKVLVTMEDTKQEVMLIVTKDTVIKDEKTKKAYKLSDLKVGMEIEGAHSLAMTRSIPGQTVCFEITIEDKDEKEDEKVTSVEYEGKIKSVEEDRVLVTMEDSKQEVMLVISKDTIIKHEKNKKNYKLSDLKAGMEIEGTHSLAMTRSIPGQTACFEIVIKD